MGRGSAAQRRGTSEYEKRYRAEHPAKIREIKRRYRLRHAEKLRAYQHAYYLKNRARILAKPRKKPNEQQRIAAAARQRQYRRENADKIRERDRRYRATHPERARLWRRNYVSKHRERVLAYGAEYRAKNREAIRANLRAFARAHADENRKRARDWWFANHDYALERLRTRARERYANDPGRREYLRKWQKQHYDRVKLYLRVSEQRRRAAKGNQAFTAAEWLRLAESHAGRCAYCGTRSDKLEADHRVPLSRGGANLIENILPSCPKCNRKKHRMTEDEFRAFLAAQSRTPAANRARR